MKRHNNENNRDSRHYYDWLEFAAVDLYCAGILLREKQCLPAAGFHCQQTVEKALKSFILFKTDSPVDGHNITWLCKAAAKQDETLLKWLPQTPIMNRMYIETRYPADISVDYSPEELQSVHGMASEMYDYICKQVYDVSLQPEDAPQPADR